jgi:hypothetical protein
MGGNNPALSQVITLGQDSPENMAVLPDFEALNHQMVLFLTN